MPGSGTVFLMYHELERPGRPLCLDDPGYRRYLVAEQDFRAHLARLREAGLRGCSVGEALSADVSGQRRVALTFDDGYATDLLAAAPALAEAGFGATFYVVAGFLGRPGYLSPAQLRELAAAGFEIGCHSMTHAYLSDLALRELAVEIAESGRKLEGILGRAVEHFSCPGGRWSAAVARTAQQAGYRSVATSRVGRNGPGADPFRLARVAVLRGTHPETLALWCNGQGLLGRRLRDAVLGGAKALLGNRTYEKFRGVTVRGT